MIWHIFKKDWTLLWRFAAGLAALYFALMIALLRIGLFRGPTLVRAIEGSVGFGGGDRTLYNLTSVFPLLTSLATALLIAAMVQQDAIPGVRQDWLVRPIWRRDLLLAKALGVLLMVLAPIAAVDLLGVLFSGFPLGQALTAAFVNSLWLFFVLALPVFAFASLTKNLTEAIVGGIAVGGVQYLGRILWTSPPTVPFLNHGRVDWIDQALRISILTLGAAALLGLQYYRRKTLLSRVLVVVLLLSSILFPTVPWQTAFALEQRLSPSSTAGNTIGMSFVPDKAALVDRPVGPTFRAEGRSDAFVLLPVQATGVPDESVLFGNSSTVRLTTPDGQTYTLPPQTGFQIWREARGEGEKPITSVIRVPRSLYGRIANQPLRAEIDYSLTLLRLVDQQSLRATGGDQESKGLGKCGARVSEQGSDVLFGCIQAGRAPTCASIVLEYAPSGARNRRVSICRPDYSPFRRNYGPDAMSRFTETLPFGSPSGDDLYPIKESMLSESYVRARLYEAKEHYTRQIVIPEIQLSRWVAAN